MRKWRLRSFVFNPFGKEYRYQAEKSNLWKRGRFGYADSVDKEKELVWRHMHAKADSNGVTLQRVFSIKE
jgi:hypothetical protein